MRERGHLSNSLAPPSTLFCKCGFQRTLNLVFLDLRILNELRGAFFMEVYSKVVYGWSGLFGGVEIRGAEACAKHSNYYFEITRMMIASWHLFLSRTNSGRKCQETYGHR